MLLSSNDSMYDSWMMQCNIFHYNLLTFLLLLVLITIIIIIIIFIIENFLTVYGDIYNHEIMMLPRYH
jgi:hypothetical protein